MHQPPSGLRQGKVTSSLTPEHDSQMFFCVFPANMHAPRRRPSYLTDGDHLLHPYTSPAESPAEHG